jgi:subtilisin family serine protease
MPGSTASHLYLAVSTRLQIGRNMALPTGVLRCAAAWILLVQCCSGFLAPRSQIQARLNHPDDAADLIPNHYIVHFHANHTLADHYANTGVNVSEVASLFVHWPLFNSYHFKLDQDNQTLVHDLIRRDPGVEWMSHNAALRWKTDQEVHHVSSVDLNHVGHTPGGSNSSSGRQLGKRWDKTHTQHAQWHISMTTMSKKLDFSGHDVYDPRPMWEAAWLEDAGKGVTIYIFDTGVNKEHAAFEGMKEEGRIWNFKSVSDDTIGPYTDEDQASTSILDCPPQ